MSQNPRILAFSGSTRKNSLNKHILGIAVKGAEEAGTDVTVLNLADYPLPLYDGDLEAQSGLPQNALRLKEIFMNHQGLLIASPEYNSSITPLLKNTLDWVSRSAPNETSLSCFVGKTAALISASPGSLGGLRSLYQLRSILSNIKVIVLPDPVAVPKATLELDPKTVQLLKKHGASLASLLSKLA